MVPTVKELKSQLKAAEAAFVAASDAHLAAQKAVEEAWRRREATIKARVHATNLVAARPMLDQARALPAPARELLLRIARERVERSQASGPALDALAKLVKCQHGEWLPTNAGRACADALREWGATDGAL